MSRNSRRYSPAGNTRLAAKIRADDLAGQLPVCNDGVTQERWLVIHGYGPESFERANLVIDDTVPLVEHNVLRPLSENPDLSAEAYIRS